MSGAGGGGRGGRGGGGGEGRLTKALVDTGKADSAGMNFRALHDPGLIMLTAGLNKDQSPDEVRKLLIDTLEGVIKNPPTKEETERVTTTLLRNLEKNLSDP
jgi:zinc protease